MSVESRGDFDKKYTWQGITDFTIEVTESQAATITKSLNDKAANPGTYSLIGDQCTSVAIKSLNASGVTIKTNPLIANGNQELASRLTSPEMLKSALRMHENKPMVTKIKSYGGN